MTVGKCVTCGYDNQSETAMCSRADCALGGGPFVLDWGKKDNPVTLSLSADIAAERERCAKIAKSLEADEVAFHIREGHPA